MPLDPNRAKEDDTRQGIEEQAEVEIAEAVARGQPRPDKRKLLKELQRIAELQDRRGR